MDYLERINNLGVEIRSAKAKARRLESVGGNSDELWDTYKSIVALRNCIAQLKMESGNYPKHMDIPAAMRGG